MLLYFSASFRVSRCPQDCEISEVKDSSFPTPYHRLRFEFFAQTAYPYSSGFRSFKIAGISIIEVTQMPFYEGFGYFLIVYHIPGYEGGFAPGKQLDLRCVCVFVGVGIEKFPFLHRIRCTREPRIGCWRSRPNTAAGTEARRRAWTLWIRTADGTSTWTGASRRPTATYWSTAGGKTWPSARTGRGPWTVAGPAGHSGRRARKTSTVKSPRTTGACARAGRAPIPSPSTAEPTAKDLQYRCVTIITCVCDIIFSLETFYIYSTAKVTVWRAFFEYSTSYFWLFFKLLLKSAGWICQ